MATLQNKKVVVVGGSSGIGFAVALGALQSLASLVIIASSNKARVEDAVARLKAHNLPGEIRGEVLDAKDSDAVKAFAVALGAVDHIVWTSGDVPKAELGGPSGPFSIADSVDKGQGIAGQRPFPGGALGSSVATALEGLTRGLAVDIAPVRVNLICPGLINTELIEKMFGEHKDHITKTYVEKILMKRGGDPSECAEAYLFVMKCGYITGQKIDVEGGYLLI
ncbi:Short-chain dehydrogenase/reductase ucsE [Psilocybe cubensis]|uniref:Short-chain dehydrogenase/reductase ucsE n=1 Tax=Psilocybe cubensis TaxID=181762 RepID=A0ACB8GLB3_PSICU|nr:Short-chain dehydrogenase/reductase ucsE [Psilocybe cubensis]KAH9476379.1 Short-chain dehydrogenase/reductase ucsE [Psilocybe cubensis]